MSHRLIPTWQSQRHITIRSLWMCLCFTVNTLTVTYLNTSQQCHVDSLQCHINVTTLQRYHIDSFQRYTVNVASFNMLTVTSLDTLTTHSNVTNNVISTHSDVTEPTSQDSHCEYAHYHIFEYAHCQIFENASCHINVTLTHSNVRDNVTPTHSNVTESTPKYSHCEYAHCHNFDYVTSMSYWLIPMSHQCDS